MSVQYFVFEWYLNEKNKIVEEIPVSDYESYLSKNGTIAEEIFLTCMIRSVEQKNDFFAFDTRELLADLTGVGLLRTEDDVFGYLQQENLSQENFIAINFDVLEKLVFTYVYHICTNYPQGIKRTRKTDTIMGKLHEIISSALTTPADSNEYEPHPLRCNYTKEDGLNKFSELIDSIKESNVKKSYIQFKEKKKCIALYKKWAGQELTIAFSGHFDCVCNTLYDFFNVKEGNRRYDDYKKIAETIGAQLAGTSCSVSRYDFDGTADTVVRYDDMNAILYSGQTDTLHSCCERKIFSFLEDRYKCVYSGKLFVKYPPCRECALSILHHLTLQGRQFSMFVGLPAN